MSSSNDSGKLVVASVNVGDKATIAHGGREFYSERMLARVHAFLEQKFRESDPHASRVQQR